MDQVLLKLFKDEMKLKEIVLTVMEWDILLKTNVVNVMEKE